MRFRQLTPLFLAVIVFAAALSATVASAQPSPTNNQDPILSQPFLDNRYLFSDAAPGRAISADAVPAAEQAFGVVRSRRVNIDANLLTGGPAVGAQAAADTSAADNRKIVLNLFGDVNLIAVVDKVNFTDKGVNWIGKVEGDPTSSVIFVTQDGVCSGNVRYLGKYYEIRFAAGGTHVIKEVDQDQLPDEYLPLAPPDAQTPGGASAAPLDGGTVALPDSPAQIDVMVLYTAGTRDANGGVAGVESLVNLAVLETNQAYANSQITTQLNLVYTGLTSYTESGSVINDLDFMTGKFDTYMDDVHALRDTYGADLVVLLTSGPAAYCGVAWIMDVVSPTFEELGFSVTHYSCATGNYTFGHELGHNQGCAHDIANAGTGGAFPYSYGYQNPSGIFRTVMAYDCPGGCPRVQHFSNPSVNYVGLPTGVVNAADNAQTINNTALTVANFRESTYAGMLPAMISPVPGSEIASSTQVFTWSSTSVIEDFYFQIGTAPATNNIYDSGNLGIVTSHQAVNIPQNGSTIYVRLWYQINQAWGFIDYVYTTFYQPPAPAVLTSPTPGSQLNASPTTFTWSTGTGASQYYFTLGTSPGSSNLAGVNTGLGLSAQAAIPLDGNPVYAEVFAYTSSGWISDGPVQYSTLYVPTGEAQIQTPAPGSTLTSTPTTFTWDSGSGALQFWFTAGTTPGGTNLVTVNKGLSTSHSVAIPLNGNPIYVEVWTRLSSGWLSSGPVQYNTGNQLPTFTSPTPGSTISASPATFTWTSMPGALQYIFILGTTPGGSDIASLNRGTATNATTQLNLNGSPVYADIWVQTSAGWANAGPVQYNTFGNPDAPANLVSPTAGSTISSSPVTFTWDTGNGALQYVFTLGTSPGGTNLANVNKGTATSHTMSLALNGTPVYAEVWTKLTSGWQASGPVMYNRSNQLSQLTSPAPGTTLTSTPVTFNWTATAGATNNVLALGTSPGVYDIHNKSYGTGTSATVNVNLTGNPIYAEVWVQVAGSWALADSETYNTANNPNGPGIIQSPTPGSTLTSSPVTFVWSPGQAATQHYLAVGTTPGGVNIYGANLGAGTQATVNVPLTGSPVYAEVWSQVAGTWMSDGPVTFQTQ